MKAFRIAAGLRDLQSLAGRAAVAAIGLSVGCMPSTRSDDTGSGDADETGETGETDETTPDPDLPDPSCVDSNDCGYCSSCWNGTCEPEVGSCECGSLESSRGFRCSPPYDCWDDSECSSGEVCVDMECQPDYVPNEPPECEATRFVTAAWSTQLGAHRIAAVDLNDDGVVEVWYTTSDSIGAIDPFTGETLAAGSFPGSGELHGLRSDGSDRLVAVVDGVGYQLLSAQWDGEVFEWVEGAMVDEAAVASTVGDLDLDGALEVVVGRGDGMSVWGLQGSAPVLEATVDIDVDAYWGPLTVTGPDPATRLIAVTRLFDEIVFTDPSGVVVDRTFAGGIPSGRVNHLETGPAMQGHEPTLVVSAAKPTDLDRPGPNYSEFAIGWLDNQAVLDDLPYAVPGGTHGVAFADLLGDESPEAILATDTRLTIVRFGLANVECFTVQMSDGSRDVTAADVDGDGRLDLLALGQDGTVTIVRHAG